MSLARVTVYSIRLESFRPGRPHACRCRCCRGGASARVDPRRPWRPVEESCSFSIRYEDLATAETDTRDRLLAPTCTPYSHEHDHVYSRYTSVIASSSTVVRSTVLTLSLTLSRLGNCEMTEM